MRDIEDYIKSVMYTRTRWKEEQRILAVDFLTGNSNGM
jgi:hypothetical protein